MITDRSNFALGNAVLAEGTNANTFKTTANVDYVIDGRLYTLAATDNIAFAAHTGTSITAMAAKKTAAFFFMVNAAGTVTVIQSDIKDSTAGTAYEPGVWEWPQRSGFACLGALVIRTDGSATFTAGSTDLGASNVVDTFIQGALGVYQTPITY